MVKVIHPNMYIVVFDPSPNPSWKVRMATNFWLGVVETWQDAAWLVFASEPFAPKYLTFQKVMDFSFHRQESDSDGHWSCLTTLVHSCALHLDIIQHAPWNRTKMALINDICFTLPHKTIKLGWIPSTLATPSQKCPRGGSNLALPSSNYYPGQVCITWYI